MDKNKSNRPKVITLCGSIRFAEVFAKENLRLTLEGNIVLSIGCDTKSDALLFSHGREHTPGSLSEQEKEMKIALDILHFRKIDLSDEIFVLNCGGYIGESTMRDILYALGTGVEVRYLEPETKFPELSGDQLELIQRELKDVRGETNGLGSKRVLNLQTVRARLRDVYFDIQGLISEGKINPLGSVFMNTCFALSFFEPVREMMSEEEKRLYRKKVIEEIEKSGG